MRILRRLAAVGENIPLAMTVGNFDGMHVGHRVLLQRLAEESTGFSSAMMTFEPHPTTVLRPQTPFYRLYGLAEKYRAANAAGVGAMYLLRFNRALAQLSAEDFSDILFGRLGVRRLVVGENFRYGAGGRGDLTSLRAAAARQRARVIVPPLVTYRDEAVSSKRVRAALAAGDFRLASQMLGRDWHLEGTVVRGCGRGRQWGFPTANFALRFVPPCRGIFAAWAVVGGRRWPAAVSVGSNPMFADGGRLRVEAFLLGFDRDLYGRRLRVLPQHKLREEKSFASTQALVDGIADDVEKTAALLKV